MHLLTREVSFTRRSSRTHAILFLIASAVFVAGNLHGFYRGLAVGARQQDGAQVVQTDAACGITDPLACATSILESVADLFRPKPEFTVVVTPFSAVVCEDVERDYEACLADEACGAEKLGTLAQVVLECMPPAQL